MSENSSSVDITAAKPDVVPNKEAVEKADSKPEPKTDPKPDAQKNVKKREAKPEPEKVVLQAIHDFPWPHNGAVIPFKKGQIITDPILVRLLLEGGGPVKRVEEKIDFQVCPNCFHTY